MKIPNHAAAEKERNSDKARARRRIHRPRNRGEGASGRDRARDSERADRVRRVIYNLGVLTLSLRFKGSCAGTPYCIVVGRCYDPHQ
jgi:hypothetical protein